MMTFDAQTLSAISTLVADVDASLSISDVGLNISPLKISDIDVTDVHGVFLGTIAQTTEGVRFIPSDRAPETGICFYPNYDKKIQNIKGVRQVTNMGLKEAKDVVDRACAMGSAVIKRTEIRPNCTLAKALNELFDYAVADAYII